MTAAAASKRHTGRRRRRHLKAVPDQAGPPPKPKASHPVVLGKDMRARLRGAVHALLATPKLAKAKAPAQMAAIVLMSRTPNETGVVKIHTRELGRWIGLSKDRTAHVAVPVLKDGVTWWRELCPEEDGEVGMAYALNALKTARGQLGHPLNLSKREYACLHALVEELFAPGWHHDDRPDTPPGLLGEHTGHGAAVDRLALLLMVLECGDKGQVALCGGRVDTHRGRPAATLARLLGSSDEAAERVLTRLEKAEVVERPRRKTRSELNGKSRLVVPTVAAAQQAEKSGEPEVVDPANTTRAGSAPADAEKPQVNEPHEAEEPEVVDPANTTDIHAPHSPVADEGGETAGSGGFSGEAPSGNPGRPERVSTRESEVEKLAAAPARLDSLPPAGDDGGALRAEKLNSSPPAVFPMKCGFPGLVAKRLPRTTAVLQPLLPEVSAYRRRLLERLLGGLLAEGDDDAMIAARLRERLAKLATGGPGRPYRFRRDALSWALSIGLPAQPGGRTLVPCAVGGCGDRVWGRVTDLSIRCDACELAARDRHEADRARAAFEEALAAPLPPVEEAPAGPDPMPAQVAGTSCPQQATVVPSAVSEQIALLETIDPTAARTAREAAEIMYRPVGPDESHARFRERTTRATWAWTAVCERYADLLAAHYAPASSGGAA